MISICLFGSEARKTADSLSDRDVLVIGRQSPEIENTAVKWRASGWNVTVLSRQAFRRMAEVKALFVQHIKQEGQILRDDRQFVASVVANFSPKPDYLSEGRDVVDQMKLLPSPGINYWFDLCIGDITYVLFRNLAIMYFASKGEYIFDYPHLANRMADEFQLLHREREALGKLREMKHAYRSRRYEGSILSWLPIARDATSALSDRLHNNIDLSSIALGDTTDNYFRLRMVELDLLRRHDPRVLDKLQPHESGFEEWHAICHPGGYPKPKGIRGNPIS